MAILQFHNWTAFANLQFTYLVVLQYMRTGAPKSFVKG